ncbi:MAG: amino acid ABC transporter substrate-binding protein [Clostridiales bacterium]|nr:amino acid ABC transporter substrate-binding protein [Clostridiales bacterium]
MKKFLALVMALTLCCSITAAVADTLTMVTNASFPPYEYYDGETIVGIDADIAAAICQKLGYELVITDMEFDSLIPAVSSGKADFAMAGMTVTDERAQLVNFSKSYATGIQAIIVKDGSPIASVDDLFVEGSSNKIGVQLSTTGDLYTTWDIEEKGLGTVVRYSNGNDAVMALLSGKVDCVVIDKEPAKAYVAANTGLVVLDTEYAIEDYAACIAKGNEEFLAKFDAALDELSADGTVQSIIDQYISAE